MNTRYIFIRHAEANKNSKKIVGGSGTGLTKTGLEQAHGLFERIIALSLNKEALLYTSPLKQAKETAKVLSVPLGCDVIESEELLPADMGILTGLSEEEIKNQFPNEYTILEKWRNREIDILGLKPLQISDPMIFWNRMLNFIQSTHNGKCNVVVCTRSVMVLISNYVDGHTPREGGNYMHVDIDNCGLIVFDIEDDGRIIRIE